ncbi:MAG: hypothetical protein AAF566_02710 [Pseudomonadota bacterium]
MMLRYTLSALAVFAAIPATAQSSLGVTGIELRAGADDSQGSPVFGALTFDAAITEYHGIQGRAMLRDNDTGTEGRLDGHLYMVPREGQKYGFFGFLSDFDGRSATYGGVGAEGLFALGDDTALELRAGLGIADQDSLDFLFAEAGLYHDLSESVTVSVSTTLTELDEAAFSTISHDLRLGLEVHPQGQPVGFFADVSRDGFSGDNIASGETTFRAGITVEFGTMRSGGPETRPFSSPQPLRPLTRRNLF